MILKLFQTLNPFESVAFYFNYLRRVDSFRNDGHALQRGQFGLFLCIIFLKSAHFGFLFAYPLNKVDQILQFDIVTLILGDQQLNIIGTTGLMMTAYLYHVFFVSRFALLNNSALKKVLCVCECSKQNSVKMKRKLVFIFNQVQSFNMVNETVNFALYCYLVLLLFRLRIKLSLLQLLLYNCSLAVFTLFFSFVLFHYLKFFSLVVSIGTVQMALLLEPLKSIVAILTQLITTNSKIVDIRRGFRFYCKDIVNVLHLFKEYNGLYGHIFTVFLLLNMPVSVYFSRLFIFSIKPVPFITQLYLGNYSVLLLVCIFALHYYLTQFTRQFEEPSFLLMRIIGRQSRRQTNQWRKSSNSFFKTHFQMALFVQTMITVRQVGMTYDRFGMVTVKSFVFVRVVLRLCDFIWVLICLLLTLQFLLLYAKCILISYKLVKHI